MYALEYNTKKLLLHAPVVMGIINASPDSFHQIERRAGTEGLLEVAEKMLKDGATILDIGGASSRPGADLVSADEERRRVVPAIAEIRKRFPEAWLSVDTYHASVAMEAVQAGADIVNDISAGAMDPNMLSAVAALGTPYIAMHMQGTPQTMQQDPQYDNVAPEILQHLRRVVRQCHEAGINQVIVDPGFGFGKTVAHNFELLQMLRLFHGLGCPVLAGLSRKSIVCKPLKVNPENALNGTTALNMAALMNGANILRVHDVKEAREVVTLYEQMSAI